MSTAEDVYQEENTVEPPEKMVDLSLHGDQALQRYLLKRVQYGREFRFHFKSDTCMEGFVTALDEYWIQISTNNDRDPQAYLLSIDAIQNISETGKGLQDYSEFFQEKIREYSKALRQQCAREINAQRKMRSKRD
jgi:hypothetical protein